MKKFLSLVLALIMTMSLVTISAGATEYRDLTDKDEIQYEEAVAVLNRIGVITGYEDGSFRPETELTRGAAAKIIVSLMIGPDAASALPNNASPYPDVPAGHTFAGVIGYCKTAGYISGYGDGTFKPANPLTGYAFAKMLLGAIGYKSNIEGFVDTGWTMNVARIGNVAGLFDRLDFDGAKAVTRDEACQLALNTLKATMVDYGNANTVVSSNGQVLTVQGSKAQYVTSNNRDINANINRRVISATNNELTLEFGEEHFKDLRLEHDRYDPAYDIYGHPSNEWSYKKVTIGTFPLAADFTFTKQISHIEDTAATKEKALGLRGYDTYSTDHRGGYVSWSTPSTGISGYSSPFADATQIHINGWEARVRNADYKQGNYPAGVTRDGQIYTYDARSIGSANKEEAPSLSEIADLTDNGVTVEVYVCPVDADFITDVVVTRTQLMKVDRFASDAIYMETISPDTKDQTKGGKELWEIAGYNDNALNVEVVSVKDNNYDAYNTLKDLKAGDRVAIIPYTTDDGKSWEVGEAYVPETVSGALTQVDIYNTSKKPDGNAVAITIGGTSYPIAQWNKDMIETSGPEIKATKKDVTLYLDKLGNALWADEIGNSDDWMVVGDYYQAAGASGRVGWFVHGWTIGGVEIDLDLGTIRGEAEKYAPGELVRYAIADAGNGEYTLSKPNYYGNHILKNEYSITGFDTSAYGRKVSNGEPILKDNKGNPTGEGVYTIAQYANRGTATTDDRYEIKKGNDYLPLEFYNTTTDKDNKFASVTGMRQNYSLADKDNVIGTSGGMTVLPFGDDWEYKSAPYDGVKFIFVGFDNSTGEVDTIDVVSGVQSVEHNDLLQINRWWRNIGTNQTGTFVASPAEAYVNKDGKVKAVVIKNDAAEPSMSDYYWITDNRGANTSVRTVNSIGADEAPTSGTYYTRQYVCGADGFKEEKTGYFDKALEVGTIITGRKGTDGIIKSRVFHATEYTNKNPDALYVSGIGRVKTLNDKTSNSSFVVGGLNTLGTANNVITQVGTGTSGSNSSTKLDATNCYILGDQMIMGGSSDISYKGLIKVDSSTQFIDLRPGRPGDIKDLEDLWDYNNDDNIVLKVLLNGSITSDGFRRAYAIAIISAGEAPDNAKAPNVTINGTVAAKNVKPVSRTVKGTKADPYVWQIAPETNITLTATVTGTGTIENSQWYNETDAVTTNGTVITVESPEAAEEGKPNNYIMLRFSATNYDNTVENVTRTSKEVWVKVESVAEPEETGDYSGTFTSELGFKFSWTAVVDATTTYAQVKLTEWPEWVPEFQADGTTAVTIAGKVKGDINGTPAGSASGAVSFTKADVTAGTAKPVSISSYSYTKALKLVEDTSDTKTYTNAATTKFVPSHMAVEYVDSADVNGTSVYEVLKYVDKAASTKVIPNDGTGIAPSLVINSNVGSDIITATIAKGAGVTNAITHTDSITDMAASIVDGSTGKLVPDASTKSVIKVELKSAAELTATVKLTADQTSNAVKNAFDGTSKGVLPTGNTEGVILVPSEPTAATTGVTAGTVLTLSAKMSGDGSPTDSAVAYLVEVTVNGTVYSGYLAEDDTTGIVLRPAAGGSANITLNTNVVLGASDIKITSIPAIKIADAYWTGDTITIVFNRPVNAVTPTYANAPDGAGGTGTDVNSTTWSNDKTTLTVVAKDVPGTTMTLTFAQNAIVDANLADNKMSTAGALVLTVSSTAWTAANEIAATATTGNILAK